MASQTEVHELHKGQDAMGNIVVSDPKTREGAKLIPVAPGIAVVERVRVEVVDEVPAKSESSRSTS